MTDRVTWRTAFTAGAAPLAVAALHRAWEALAAVDPADFGPGCAEPDLTEKLCLYLRGTQADDRLPGLWSYENLQAELVKTGDKVRVFKRKRTDIQYFTEIEKPPLHLIFEFKKLSHHKAQRDKYAGDEGILRFVTGEYSLRQPLALMVGILTVHHDDCVPTLEGWLNGPEAKTVLYMETAGGVQARRPSQFFEVAAFDTEHLRPTGKGPAHGTIVVSHLFLDFPDLPRVATKRARRQALAAALDA